MGAQRFFVDRCLSKHLIDALTAGRIELADCIPVTRGQRIDQRFACFFDPLQCLTHDVILGPQACGLPIASQPLFRVSSRPATSSMMAASLVVLASIKRLVM
ncbi:hypothetical protein D3C84_1134150 [compost metagenome]